MQEFIVVGDQHYIQCSSLHTSTITYISTFEVLVRILNPKKKSEYDTQALRTDRMFRLIEELKTQRVQDYQSKAPEKTTQLGFNEPGQGTQKWINTEENLKQMYDLPKGKDKIILWCFHAVRTISSYKTMFKAAS